MDFDKRGGWKIFMKSINVEGGFYFVEDEIFQILEKLQYIEVKQYKQYQVLAVTEIYLNEEGGNGF